MKLQELIDGFKGYEDAEITFSGYSDPLDTVDRVNALLVKEVDEDPKIILIEA